MKQNANISLRAESSCKKKLQIENVSWKELEVPLEKEKTSRLLKRVVGWQLADGSITKNYEFKDFKQAVKFVNAVAEIAEKENQNPQILLWRLSNVKLTLKTYCINGLSKLDFSLASKIDKIELSDSQNLVHKVNANVNLRSQEGLAEIPG